MSFILTFNSYAKNCFNAEQSFSVQLIYLNNSVAIIGLRSGSFFISNGFVDFKCIANVDIFAIGLLEVYILFSNLPSLFYITTLPARPNGLSYHVCHIPPPYIYKHTC